MDSNESKSIKDAEVSLKKADKMINKGFFGWLNRIFIGKKNTNDLNKTITDSNETLSLMKKRKELMNTGKDASAIVLSIAETGKILEYLGPVIKIRLNVMSDIAGPFEIETEQISSQFVVPKIGDRVNIKYNPKNIKELIII